MALPQALYTAEQVKLGEVKAAEHAGVELYQLMLRAGEAAYLLMKERFPTASHIAVICGSGNNGGDGFVVAKLAKQSGFRVELFLTSDAARLTGDAAKAYQAWIESGGDVTPIEQLSSSIQDCDVVFDAILGTGLQGAVRSTLIPVLQLVNRSGKPIIAIDIPSGLCADTGQVLGDAIYATHTISFIGLKQGLVTGQAREFVGELHFAGLGVDVEFAQLFSPSAVRLVYQDVVPLLPNRSATAHKGNNGRVLCIGGNKGYAGAIRLCSQAATRSGAGLVSALCHTSSLVPLQVACPEVMAREWLGDRHDFAHQSKQQNVIAIGPGLGTDDWACNAMQWLSDLEVAKVIDADGLNLLAQSPNHDMQRVLTPHPGEAARLLGVTVKDVEENRYHAVIKLQQQYGGVVVLKGAGTLIADGKQIFVCAAGNPGMASGGMGDVLTGVIAALIAQGLSIAEATKLAVVVHSQAADDLAALEGPIGLAASDLIIQIRRRLNGLDCAS